MNLLLRLGGWITDHPKSFCAALFLAGGLLGVLAGRRMCATPTIKEEATATTAAIAASTTDTKTQEGPWTRETWEYVQPNEKISLDLLRQAPPPKAALRREPQATAEGPLVLHSIEKHEGSASETHASSGSAQSTTQTLKLEQQDSSASQWALGASLEGAFGARILRLSVRRQILGPIWLEASAIPATRAVGAGLAVEW